MNVVVRRMARWLQAAARHRDVSWQQQAGVEIRSIACPDPPLCVTLGKDAAAGLPHGTITSIWSCRYIWASKQCVNNTSLLETGGVVKGHHSAPLTNRFLFIGNSERR